MSRITIVLADDHHVVRRGLRLVLESELDCGVVGEAATGIETIALVEQHQPDLLIVDLMLPGLNGLEVTRRVRQLAPKTQVLVLSMHGDATYVREALQAGATAYVLKAALSIDFVYAVQQAAAGQRYLSPVLADLAIEAYLQQPDASVSDHYEALTPREREVLYLAAQGRTSAEIAERLDISARTVEAHRAKLLRKLGLRTHSELVRYAIRRGMLAG